MLNYLATQDESKCCGCGACVEICPTKALSMKPNKEGFQYPALDANRCVDCKLCEKVCPEMNPPQKAEPLDIYALQSKNAEELFESSSGGAWWSIPVGRRQCYPTRWSSRWLCLE